VGNLFSDAANERLPETAPLAMRMRPQRLEDFVGQEQVLGEHSALRLAIEEDRVGSSILYGPPGSGKTTLARVIANTTGAAFEELSAVSATVAQVREILKAGRERLGANGQRTILFLDEIHRFNKAQQDALLPAVEEGTVTLIGATTENPYFEVNSALLSRSQIYELVPLTDEELAVIVRRGAEELKADVPEELVELIARRAGGDARNALNIVERAVERTRASTNKSAEMVDLAAAEDALQRKAILYDRDGDRHYDYISAWIKSTRGSDPDASLYYLAAMLEGGEDPRFIARRMVILASEDIGNADPQALTVATAAAAAVDRVGLPECALNLAQAATYLALAPKSNAATLGISRAGAHIREHGAQAPPPHLQDAHYPGAKELGRGEGYRYPHDEGGGATDQPLVPEEVQGERFYEPTENGFEAELRRRLAAIRERIGLNKKS
jgi:putative ATPase